MFKVVTEKSSRMNKVCAELMEGGAYSVVLLDTKVMAEWENVGLDSHYQEA